MDVSQRVHAAPAQYCEIRVRGHLAPRCSDWFEGLALTHTESGHTILSGPVADQEALRGLVGTVLDMQLTLVSVKWTEPERERRQA